MSFEKCISWGWTELLESFYLDFVSNSKVTEIEPARVISDSHGIYTLLCPVSGSHQRGRVAGRLRHEARSREEFPVVGDWVCVETALGEGDRRILHVLPRRSCLKRKAAGEGTELQVIAAQIDEIWIITSCDQDLSPNRLDRALVLAGESGARSRILLSKSDLLDAKALEEVLDRLRTRLIGVPIHAISNHTGQGLQELESWTLPGQTFVVIGSSGVGKSTLINKLLGQELLAVQATREADAKGRHTTTGRSLHKLAGGAMLIDTPGTRELQVFSDEASLKEAFSDVGELAARCKFSDCDHEFHEGCAILEALVQGKLSPDRWLSFRKLQKEMAFHERNSSKLRMNQDRRRWSKVSKDAKLRGKAKRGRR
jgi:ribosome biogenesis GTPase / thiamine phosphate phosphatase